MNKNVKSDVMVIGIIVIVGLITCILALEANKEKVRQKKAFDAVYSQVKLICEKLDTHTTEGGSYIRQEIKEKDIYGSDIIVTYKKGGFAEELEVRSAGPDKILFNDDDVVARESKVNLSGVGSGIRDNVEETGKNAVSGLVQGIGDGIKKTFKKDETKEPSKGEEK